MNRFRVIHNGSILAGMIIFLYPFSTFIWEDVVMATEEPAYSVVESYDDFEIRSYEANLVAQIKTQGEFDSAGNQGFRVLADYIFGNNNKKSKIAMTAPVKMSGTGTADEYNIQFVMPRELKKEDLPQPKNQDLKILSIPKS